MGERIKLGEKSKLILKILFVSAVIIFVFKEFKGVVRSFNLEYFILYKNKLDFLNIMITVFLGIVSYIPLSFYDFILKRKVGINLNNKTLYKYSWIASSLSSLLGFGGATSLAFKQNFYGKYVNDKKKLLKEISKIVALNLTGLSLICIVYVFLQFNNLLSLGIIKYPIIILALYVPVLIIFLIYKYIKTKEKSEFIYTLVTILISFLEWITTVFLIYSILKITGSKVHFISILPVYIESAVIGIISMIPGGIGTFDLSFITGLSELRVPIEQTFLVIILYRISYYIIPAAIGIFIYFRDFGKNLNRRLNNLPKQIVSKIAYKSLIILVFLTGAIIVLSSIVPEEIFKIRFLKSLFEKQLVGTSLIVSIVLGFLIILSSLMLRYKAKIIYKATIIFLGLGAIFTFSGGININKIMFIVLVIYILYLSKERFYRKDFIVTTKNIFTDFIISGMFFTLYFYLTKGFSRYIRFNHIAASYEPIYRIGIFSCVIFIVAYVSIYFISKVKAIPTKTYDECKEDVDNILSKYKGSALTHLVFVGDKYVYFNEDKDVMFQYKVFKDKLFVLGNPIGNKDKLLEEIENFSAFGDEYGYTPVFYQVEDYMINYLHSNGYDFIKLGEEAKVEVETFEVVGNKMKSLKNSKNKVIKDGYTFEVLNPPFTDNIFKSLKNISDEWLDGRKEKGYSVGYFDEYYLSKAPIAIIKNSDGEIKGFSNIMYMYDNESVSVDLMRFSKNSPRGLMDFMFISIIEWAKENGYKYFNIGMAPLSNVGVSKYAFLGEKIALQIYEYGQFIYSFKGLRKYKEKFTDVWEPRYMAYRKNTSLILTAIQAAILCSKNKEDGESVLISRIRKIIKE